MKWRLSWARCGWISTRREFLTRASHEPRPCAGARSKCSTAFFRRLPTTVHALGSSEDL